MHFFLRFFFFYNCAQRRIVTFLSICIVILHAARINISQGRIVICICISRVNLHPATFTRIRTYLFEREVEGATPGVLWSVMDVKQLPLTLRSALIEGSP